MRVALTGTALLVLLALVSFATRSGFERSSGASGTSSAFESWAFTAFLVLFVLAVPVAAYLYMTTAHRDVPQAPRPFALRVVRSLALIWLSLAIAAFVVWVRRHHPGMFHFHLRPLPGAAGGAHGGGAKRPGAGPTFEWPLAWVALGLSAAAAVAWAVRRRRAVAAVPPEAASTLAADVAASIGDAIDDLEREPDPRRAVIAAYARMEGMLGRRGLSRQPSETPLEYLRRILLSVTSRGDAVQQLTGLFEQARFSGHEIDGAMQRQAIGALRAIRDDLAGAGT